MRKIPVLPLRSMAVFPHMLLHFDVIRMKSIKAIEEAMLIDQLVFLCSQKDNDVDLPKVDDIYKIGVVVKVKQILKLEKDNIKVLVEGLYRAEIKNIESESPFILANIVEYKDDNIAPDSTTNAYMRSILDALSKYLELSNSSTHDLVSFISNVEEPSRFADIVAGNMYIKNEKRQAILEALDVKKRLELIYKFILEENEVLLLESELTNKLKKELSVNQKEYILKQQMKIIKSELGEYEGRAIEGYCEDFRLKLEELKLSEDITRKIEKEIDRYSKMSEYSQDASVMNAYLTRLLDLPWNDATEDNIDMAKCRVVLDRDHYGLDDVKKRVLEYLAVKKLTNGTKSTIICLVGPPGVGKTSIAKSIADSIGRKFTRMSLGGVRDEAQIRGHRRTYVGAIPGKIMSAIEDSGVCNPVFLMDEIDKLGDDYRGDPTSALLEVLDPEQNHTFTDHYYDVPFDLSKVMFITTANSLEYLSRPLLDRMEVIEISGYTSVEKFNIAKKYLIPNQMKEHGLSNKDMSITSDALRFLIERYTRESGVRGLERKIAKVCRQIAFNIVSEQVELSDNESAQKHKKITVDKKKIIEILSEPKKAQNHISKSPQVGIANGLAWTSVGGDTLQIEALTLPGTGKIELTGQMGDVMQESARAGISYLRANYEKYGIDKDFYKDMDIHIHIPEGAVPKDGPSAGITMTAAVLSALTNRKLKNDVAMTGEITLRGNVLQIGGLKEKSLAANRDGIKNVIIPLDNEKDILDIPEVVSEKLEFICVKHFDEVFKHIFV